MKKITKAEYIRRMSVSGARFTCTQHAFPKYVGTTRIIARVQKNGVYFLLDDDQQRHWSPFNAVRLVMLNDDESMLVYFHGDEAPRLTLKPA